MSSAAQYRDVGPCSLCGQGLLLLAWSRAAHELVIICDDCESQWANPQSVHDGDRALKEERSDLVPATDEQIANAGWQALIDEKKG